MVKALSASDFRYGCPLAAVTLGVASDRNSICDACEQGFQIWLGLFVAHLNRAGLRGARAKSLATLLLAALEGGLILSRAQRSVAPLNAIANELVRVIQSSIPAGA
jgi:TetR/AcrR family transcriptional repressor of lmrAB and yxaGH operons